METVYLICAALGGTLLLVQFLMSLAGFGDHDGFDHGDADGHDHGGDHSDGAASWFLGVLTFRTIAAGLTFFGLGGLAAWSARFDTAVHVIVAVACGVSALYLVAMLMKSLHRLKADGTVRLEKSVGQTGTVYLRIPAQNAGPGKVTLVLNSRSIEFDALTAGDELPTGAKVIVLRVISADTVEVASAPVTAPVETRTHA